MEPSLTSRVLVVGAGVSGTACAEALREAGVEVTAHEANTEVGGRMFAPEVHGRITDLGAAYFTTTDTDFAAVVDRWAARGLVRPWTDTFTVLDGSGRSSTSGPQRWVARDGLASLVADAQRGVDLSAPMERIDGSYDAVVLAMPDPQAARIVGDLIEWVDYEPVIVVAAEWDRKLWDLPSAAFVNDDPNVTLIADDGSRRGDSAPVLVAHSTSDLARAHLAEPDEAASTMLDSVRRLLAIERRPMWSRPYVWREARPAGTHGDQPFGLIDSVGLCGDSWCPAGSPRVEAAWLSGHRLGLELAHRLG